jgi:hypothetical protein
LYPTILYYAKRNGWNIQSKELDEVALNRIEEFAKRGAVYLVMTFGKPARSPISSIFPYFKYFGHYSDYDPDPLLSKLNDRFKLILKETNYAIYCIIRAGSPPIEGPE